MATLCLTPSPLTAIRSGMAPPVGLQPERVSHRAVRCIDSARPVPVLRDWLAGDWGLIFSHPGDFQEAGLEQDRWLVVLTQEFRAARVRPLACQGAALAGRADASWVSELTGDHWFVQIEGRIGDLAARQLRAELSALQSRFVMVVDEHLRRRGLLTYRPGCSRLSPLDLAASVSALRQRSGDRCAA
jgi:hypothetical protein